MQIDLIDLFKKPDLYFQKELEIKGWVRFNRHTKEVGFLAINDGTTFQNIQVVYLAERESFDALREVAVGSAIKVRGILKETPNQKQPFELILYQHEVIGTVDEDYPLQKKRHSFEFLREQAYLRGRTNAFSVIYHLRSYLAQEIHHFFKERHFLYLHAPILTGSDAEGAGEMFQVVTEEGKRDDFFGKKAHLSVSGQLNAEAFAQSFRKVYTFGPTFRAENSNTSRHAAEFWMIEPEIAFADLHDDMKLAEDLLKHLIKKCLDEKKEELLFCDQFLESGLIDKLKKILERPIAVKTYTEVIELLKNSSEPFKYPVAWGIDLKTEHERYLTEKIIQGPVFVIDYPAEIKAFYMRLNDDGKTVAAMDLLVPGIGELMGGSQREERIAFLKQAMMRNHLDEHEYEWYLNLRRYGSTPHAGFGVGFERLVMFITGIDNIRDSIPFPRVPGQIKF